MRLFVGPLAEAVSLQDVRDLIESGIRPTGPFAFLKKTPGRVNCTMMEVPGRDGRATIYFAIVHIHPATFGGKVVAKLNGTTLRGRPVSVRPYMERHPGNERRELPGIPLRERRGHDRRGHAVRRVYGAAKEFVFAPVKEFAREYNEYKD
jgi:hypothetical protein